ncbi:MAG: isochorismate synthase [Baekduia sp.]
MTSASVTGGSSGSLTLNALQQRRLLRHVRRAHRRARRRGEPVLAALTVPVPVPIDPTAVLVAARAPGEAWCALEQPERDGAVVAGLGAVVELSSAGSGRFAELARSWRSLIGAASFEGPTGAIPGSGPVAFGGLAFADDGGVTPAWSGFGSASLHVPEIAITRRAGVTRMTVSALVGAGDDPDAVAQHVADRVAGLDAAARLPAPDPQIAGRHDVHGAMPPEHYVEAVSRAVERIAGGSFEKIVLARAVDVTAPEAYRPEAILGVLREGFPECHLTVVARGDAAFVAASPELLIRREGLRASTIALAGSARRSSDPAVDDHIGEQLLQSAKDRAEHDVVTRRIVRALTPVSVWVTAADEPSLAKIANIQHLATPVRAQLAEPVGALELAGLLHPTPAVGGEPREAALPVIPALEGLDRGWYAGPVGWLDAAEDGEFVVGLRSALLRGAAARCYAGVGVVGASDPAAELAETEIKLGALLPVLTI